MHRQTVASTAMSLTLSTVLTVSTLTVGPVGGALKAAAEGAGISADPVAGRERHRAVGRAKSLVIGVDGLTFSSIAAAGAPVIDGLRRAGTSARTQLYAEPMAPTLSGPGWASILSGTWPDTHGVRGNDLSRDQLAAHPDFLSRIERAAPRLETAAVATWAPIVEDLAGPLVDRRLHGAEDEVTARRAAALLGRRATDSVFVQLDEVDLAGHAHGAASSEYAAAVRAADSLVGDLLAAVESRPTFARERWLVVVTTDHGHTAEGGHGGSSAAERGSFVIASGGGLPAGAVRHDVRVVDIAPTVLAHHGLDRAARRGSEGSPIAELRPDEFDALRPRLRGPVDEVAVGDRPGWTAEPPPGWQVVDARMPEGGTTEWRGWTFATDDFWTATDPGQGRETNVRARDVFAVADSDEWDDAPHADGRFDSTLVTPSYPVLGDRRAVLRFVTTYAVDGPQSARVLVSVDGADPVPLRSYMRPVNAAQALRIDLPRGARAVRFLFRYTGVNSAFWVVDRVRVRSGR